MQKILVVDNSPTALKIMTRLLAGRDFQVKTAADIRGGRRVRFTMTPKKRPWQDSTIKRQWIRHLKWFF